MIPPRYTVAPNVYGFGIYDAESGEPLQRVGGIVTFHGRMWAELYAKNLDHGFTEEADELLRQYGHIYP